MGWRDTVMSDGQITQTLIDCFMECATSPQTQDSIQAFQKRAIAKAQAEITWDKAIREVVEWLDKNPMFIQNKGLCVKVPIATSPEWQAKLKEWGIIKKGGK